MYSARNDDIEEKRREKKRWNFRQERNSYIAKFYTAYTANWFETQTIKLRLWNTGETFFFPFFEFFFFCVVSRDIALLVIHQTSFNDTIFFPLQTNDCITLSFNNVTVCYIRRPASIFTGESKVMRKKTTWSVYMTITVIWFITKTLR